MTLDLGLWVGCAQLGHVAPVDGAEHIARNVELPCLGDVHVGGSGDAHLQQLLPVLQGLDEAGIVNERLHVVGIEHRARLARNAGVGQGPGQEDPVRLSALVHGLPSAIFHLAWPGPIPSVGEFAHVVVLVPGVRELHLVPVLSLELCAVVRVFQQLRADHGGVQVSVYRQADSLSAPVGQPLAVDRHHVVPLQNCILLDVVIQRDQVAASCEVTDVPHGEQEDVEEPDPSVKEVIIFW